MTTLVFGVGLGTFIILALWISAGLICLISLRTQKKLGLVTLALVGIVTIALLSIPRALENSSIKNDKVTELANLPPYSVTLNPIGSTIIRTDLIPVANQISIKRISTNTIPADPIDLQPKSYRIGGLFSVICFIDAIRIIPRTRPYDNFFIWRILLLILSGASSLVVLLAYIKLELMTPVKAVRLRNWVL